MDINEIKQIEESFERTEKALEDEHILYIEKCKKCTSAYREFVNRISEEGYVRGLSGWVKKNV